MSEDSKIVSLFSKSGSTRHLTPRDLAKQFDSMCEKSEIDPTRMVMIVSEETEDGTFKIRTFHANAPSTVSLSMLEIAKRIITDEMLGK